MVYLHADQLGSTGVATNGTSQSVVSRQEYDPWGKVRAGVGYSGMSQSTVGYTGQKLDGTGLMYYHARYYDPNIGKFTSSDSIVPNARNSQAFNRYTYVSNNPINRTDPTGHCDKNIDKEKYEDCLALAAEAARKLGSTMHDPEQFEASWSYEQLQALLDWIRRGVKFTSHGLNIGDNYYYGSDWYASQILKAVNALNKVAGFFARQGMDSDGVDRALGLIDSAGNRANLTFNKYYDPSAGSAGAIHDGGKNTVNVQFAGPEDMVPELIHELGHVVDYNLAHWLGLSKPYWSENKYSSGTKTYDLVAGDSRETESFANSFRDRVLGVTSKDIKIDDALTVFAT